jgi:NitT/TauT family transport system substrate-binding protein
MRAARAALAASAALALTALAPASVFAQTPAKPPIKHTLTVAISGDTLIYMPMYVARAAGYFEDEGIKVEWVNVGPSSRQVPAVMGGSADVTPVALFHMVDAHRKGLKLVALSNIMEISAIQLTLTNEAAAKTGITANMPVLEKLKRLKGLTIGTSAPGSGTETTFRKMFTARGIDVDRWVTLKPVGGAGPTLAAFDNKLVDGVVYPAPVPEIIASKGTGKTVIDSFSEEIAELKDTPFLVLATSRDIIAKKPELMAGTTRALARAMQFSQANPQKLPALLRQYFKETDEAVFTAMVESYRKAAARTPLISPLQVQNVAKWMSIGEAAPIVVKYEDIVSPEPAAASAKALGL